MNVWDWKYRIFFDDEIKEKLHKWQAILSEEEQRVYNDISNFYCSFFSFGMLFDLIVETPDKMVEYIDKACKNQDRIIKTPQALRKYYRSKIKSHITDSVCRARLEQLFEASLIAEDILPRYKSFLQDLFGIAFSDILNVVKTQENPNQLLKIPRQRIIHGNCEELFNSIYSSLTKDEMILKEYGASSIGEFKTEIYDGNGYGEWWDKDISETGEDELVLYTNDNKVKYDDYRYTIIHETFPGHGHFYNSVRKKNECFDQGAMTLVEGWATFCEWNTYPSKYVDAIKHNALVTLNRTFTEPIDAIADEVVDRNRKKRTPIRKYISSLIYRTQYIGYIESYYLGALWIEHFLKKRKCNPQEFLQFLSDRNKGEFFRLWE